MCGGARGADYSGTYKGDELELTLSMAQGRYSGHIRMEGKQFPCVGREADGQLKGTFESDGDNFEFKATLREETLTFETGDTSYKLRRQKLAAVNPLAKPRAATPETGTSTNRVPGSASAGVVRFRKVTVSDRRDMIGGEAFSFLAPVDWKVDGGVFWRAHPTMPATVAMRVSNPKGLEQLECFPTVAFSWGGYLGPGTMFPPGANYLGNEVQPPVRNAITYLQERQVPRARAEVKARFIKSEELPKLAEAARQAEPGAGAGGPQMSFTAGRVRLEYEVGGTEVEEDLYCVLNSMSLPMGNMTIQIADKLYALRAPKGRLDDATKVFQTMINSTQINLEWYNKYVQLVQVLTQAQMNQIRAAGDLSRYISRTSSEISDMMRQSYEQRQASQDRINENWSQYMRGVDEYYNPAEQRAVELPSGYKNAWVNGSGEYIVSDRLDFNPAVELEGNWQKLERKEQ
jgi:hypothetical protein